MGLFYHPAFEVVTLFGLFLLAIAAPSHFRARNTGTILYICWTGIANFLTVVNKLIWHDNLRNPAPLWCDISAKIQIGMSVAIGASTVVINRRLFKISRISSVLVTPAQKRRDLIIDLSIGVGIPFLIMILHVIVQGHRANIIEGIGCWATTYNVWPAYLLVFMWPCLLSFIAIVFGMLSLRAFLQRRDTVEEFLNSNSSGLNVDRYFRLMCFSAVELIFAFPLGLYQLFTNAYNNQMFPYIGWADTHYKFNRFDLIPAFFINSNPTLKTSFAISLWSIPFLTYIFFIFFGLGREQRNQYKRWFYAALRPFGVQPPQPKPYGSDRRTWWQKLLRRPVTGMGAHHHAHGTGLNSSRGPTDSLPAFRHPGASYPEKPIPSARSKHLGGSGPTSSLGDDEYDDALTFDLDEHEKVEVVSPRTAVSAVSAGADMNKALPRSPGDPHSGSSRASIDSSAASASSVAGASRRVSEAIRDVDVMDVPELDMREIEARIQRLA